MAIYQPTAVVGNSRILATLGPSGEISTLFFPHLDYAQNVHEGMPAAYLGRPGLGRLLWCFDPAWERTQRYLPDTNTVVTTLTHHPERLTLTFTDLIHPERNVLARRVVVENDSPRPHILTVYQYLACRLGELGPKNSVRYLVGRAAAVQYWRSIALAIASPQFDQYQCGRVGAGNSAKGDMCDGNLGRQAEEIGEVDLAVGWDLNVPPGKSEERLLLVTAAENEQTALALAQWGRSLGFAQLAAEAESACRSWLATAPALEVPEDLGRLQGRSLLGSALLFDEAYGAFLAAPEFDPGFERSGGYGYCWPRDAAEVVCALGRVGYGQYGARFLDWAARAQSPEGYWEQRYWLNGERGPSWCTFEDSLQLDQTASVVAACAELAQQLPEPARRDFALRHWPMVSRGAEFLSGLIGAGNLHSPGSDLWETFRGSFTYSNAGIYAALQGAAALAPLVGQERAGEIWASLAAAIKQAVCTRLWVQDHFAQRLTEDGQLDARVDSSTLGVVEPFRLLNLEDAMERHMAEAMVGVIEARLGVSLADGPAIRRYEGDTYMGGMPGGVNTLWLARVLLRLALAECHRNHSRALQYYHRAQEYVRVVMRRATPTGLLPELINPTPGQPGWAQPHGWAMASYLDCLWLLDRLGREMRCQAQSPHPTTTGGQP